MQVAENKGTIFEAGLREVYATQRLEDDASEHDPRGLVAAVLLSVACWAVLGYFLLT
ncbi:hypothetical protein HT136_12275 [Novosphingobium profundi]|uniref:hypothetical protein n=1 Tax=Novosphingobium profundi TaxID=1774954 RepID=UPI001BD936B9|nr:hypothetical protein [Novosphingobium profundi]MBT0669138.1 hypothetical protein [Novosphingobium profundi]